MASGGARSLRKNGALFAGLVAHSNDEIEWLTLKHRHCFGALCGYIDTDLAHDSHGLRADGTWMCAGRENLIQITSLMPKQRLSI